MAIAEASTSASVIDDLMPTDEDLLYEEELLRNPYSLKMWWRYIQARSSVSAKRRYLLYERALRALPGSYKLWHAYLTERRVSVRGLRLDHPSVEALNNTFERALVSMHKMPRIWLEYLEILMEQKLVTVTRRVFDRALAALPITQHDRLWAVYLPYVCQPDMPIDTAVRLYRRYLKLEPSHAEEYIEYLRSKERWGEAARKLAALLNDETFRSLQGKSKHQLWLELCDMVTKHPRDVEGINVDAVLRGGIRRFTDEVGRLWTSLADYYIRRAMFEKARDVYEEGLTTVVTVRDFSLIFDALTQFEESLLSAKMEALGDDDAGGAADGDGDDGDGDDDGRDFLLKDDGNDLDLRLARLEDLMKRRPELLSSVILRQNPHNVHEWHKRVKLFEGQPTKQILTYTEAVKTVDVNKATGKLHTLWISFARFYERHGDVPNARIIFEKAVQMHFKYVDDLASVWCAWAEMELRHENYRSALEVMRRGTAAPARPGGKRLSPEEERALPPQQRLYKSLKLWSFYADLEESLGTLESAVAVYDRIFELRIVTPQVVLNYALLLQEHKHWEQSFQVYERGVALFKYPHVRDIWAAYLKHFVERYGGKKLERGRDLFEQALAAAPPEEARPLYLQYAQLEEQHGLARHAMDVYARAVRSVPKAERLPIYDIYLAKASEFFGVGKLREIYESALEAEPPHDLADADFRAMCLKYADLERKLGEVDRARRILVHGSHTADPRVERRYWAEWKKFEVAHGNEDTFSEMLRIQRSVAASFSHVMAAPPLPSAPAAAAAGPGAGAAAAAAGKRPRDTMEALEAAAEEEAAAAGGTGTRVMGFVSAGVIQHQPQKAAVATAAGGAGAAQANPEEIDLDVGGDEQEGEEHEGGPEQQQGEDEDEDAAIGQRAVPASLFGALGATAAAGGDADGEDGDRLKKRSRTQ